MKKTKVIIPALGLLVLSTAASVSGTVAWFSVNNSVSATGMQVQAKAEAGLLISADNYASSWADSDASVLTTSVGLVPTSTSNLETWYHATSTSASNWEASNAGYSTLGTTAGEGVTVVTTENLLESETQGTPVANLTYHNDNVAGYQAANDTAYYLMTRFYLKSSGDAIAVNGTQKWLKISKLTLSGVTGSGALDAALRVGVKIGSHVKILAPFAAATATYPVGPSETSTTAYLGTLASNGNYAPNVDTGLTGSETIPAASATPLNVDIYLWYEGEDHNCISNNYAQTIDTLSVSLEFSLTETAPTNTAA